MCERQELLASDPSGYSAARVIDEVKGGEPRIVVEMSSRVWCSPRLASNFKNYYYNVPLISSHDTILLNLAKIIRRHRRYGWRWHAVADQVTIAVSVIDTINRAPVLITVQARRITAEHPRVGSLPFFIDEIDRSVRRILERIISF